MLMQAHPRADSQLGLDTADAVSWVKGQLQTFYSVPLRIGNATRRAQQLQAIALAKGRPGEAQQLRDLQATLAQSSAQQTVIADRVKGILAQLGALGVQLGSTLPLALAATILATTAAMAAHLTAVNRQEGQLNALQAGLVTPQEAAALSAQAAAPGAGGLLVPALLIGGAVYFLAFRRGRRR